MERPIIEMLISYAETNADRFHMPGHKGKPGLFLDLGKYDVTETPYTGNLYEEQGNIQKARELASSAFGSKDTFFLVNGATAGVLMMMLYSRAKKMIVAGLAHRSVFSGMIIEGIEPVLLPCAIGTQAQAAEIEQALQANPGADVFVTSPDYYGLCCDLPAICETAKTYGARVFLDGAHGTHFGFASKLPPSPKDSGVEMWVNGAHKTTGALTQGAFLHVSKSSCADVFELHQLLQLLQTSSPSYLILAGLDHARAGLETGEKRWNITVDRCNELRNKINALHGLMCFGQNMHGENGVAAMDPTRLTVNVSQRGLTGFEANEFLLSQGIVAEMADYENVVFIITPHDEADKLLRLEKAFKKLPAGNKTENNPPVPPTAKRVIGMRRAFLGKKAYVPLHHAVGQIAGALVGIYPPGTCVLLPGDLITLEITEYLLGWQQKGGKLFGCRGNHIPVAETSAFLDKNL